MKPIICTKTFLSFVFVILASLSTFAQQTLWVGQSYTFDVSSSVMGITANMSWSTNGGYLSLSGSGFYRTITVTQYFSGTATVTCEWDYKLTGNGSYTHTKRQVTISCRDNQVSISPTSMTMSPGETRYVSYRHQYDNQYTSAANAYFQSSDPSICTVSSSGEVTAKNPGTTYINVYSKISSVSPYCRVTVENVTPTSVSIPSTMSMTVGEQKTLSASVYPTNAQTGINWKTSNSEIASVSSTGTVTALKHGTAQITATTDNGLSSTCNVTVNKSQLTLSSSHKPGLINKNTSIQLTASDSKASIYYTTDGSIPSASSCKYVGPIIVTGDTDIKAIAQHPDYIESKILELHFDVTSLVLLNTSPDQNKGDSAPHLYPCFEFNSSIREGVEFSKIQVLSYNETTTFETIITGNKLYIVPEKHLANSSFSVEIPEYALKTDSDEHNVLINAKFSYSTACYNSVNSWTEFTRLMDNGELYIWGYDGTFPDGWLKSSYQYTPTKISSGIKKFYDSGYYITDDGVLMGWGANYNDNPMGDYYHHILGDGTYSHQNNPVKIADNVDKMKKGYIGGILKQDHTLWLWGNNIWGQIGNGSDGKNNYALAPIEILSNVKDFALGNHHSIALTEDGSVYVWGKGESIGESNLINRPKKIIESDIVEIDAGIQHNIILDKNGDVYCFGNNEYGQIGNSNFSSYESLQKIMEDAIHVDAFLNGSVALKNNGELYRWGGLGIQSGGDANMINTPTLISSDVKEIHTTESNIIVFKNDNTVWAMGSNYWGILGLGYRDDTRTDVLTKVFEDVEKVWAFDTKIFVKKYDGTYWGIGASIGIETTGQYYIDVSPKKVFENNIIKIDEFSLPDELIIELGCKGIIPLDIEPSNANYKSWSWSSFNPDIASVDNNGIIYGNSIGETTIETTLSGYSNTYNSRCIVKVLDYGAGIETIENTLQDDNVTIYDMNGFVVCNGKLSSISDLNSGIYIIASKSKIIKYLKR